MNRRILLVLALSVLAAGPAAGSAMLGPGPAQETKPQTAPAAAETPKLLVIPVAEKNRKNPVPSTPESIESGRNLFSSQCAMCHGIKGDGKGDLVERLKLKVPDFTDAEKQKRRTDGELFYILTQGHGEMPGETRLEPREKWDMINYIRSLARPEKPGK
jgi:mono/diheme cytochrome c family protein